MNSRSLAKRPPAGRPLGRWPRVVGWCCALLVVGLAVAACGSSSSASSSSISSSSASSSAPASGSSSSVSTCVQRATTLVNQERAPMPMTIPSAKINMSSLKGKTVWYISPDQATGYALTVSQGLTAAGQAAGVNIHIFDGKDQPTLFAQGFQEAVAQHAAAIIDYAINPKLVPQGLLAAKAAHIPVLSELTGDPAPSNGTIFESVNENIPQEARSMADYAAYETKCKVNGATTYDPLYSSLITERNTIQSELAKLCPTTCKVIGDQMSLATMATALAPNVQSLIQRTSGLNTIFATFDQAATYEAPAVAQSGSSVKIVGTNGLPPNVDSIRKGSPQIADVAFVPPQYLGWLSLDQVARAILHKPTGVNGNPYILPVQTIDKTNVGSSDSLSTLFPKLANYQSAFKSLWGV